MGLFDFFRWKKQSLLDQLVDRVEKGDDAGFKALCDRERDAIRAEFPQWRGKPEGKVDPARRATEMRVVDLLARAFAKDGDLSLLQHLMGGASPVELGAWNAAMTANIAMGRSGRPAEAAQKLEALVATYAHLPGGTASNLRAQTWGQAGSAWHAAGDLQRARAAMVSALDLCRQDQDQEGVRIYTSNLAQIDAQLQQDTIRLDPVVDTPMGKQIPWKVVQQGTIPENARALQQQGLTAGKAGRFDEARTLLEAAMDAAPEWPQPAYDAASTAMYQADYKRALELYRRVDALAPGGFFTAKAAVHTLEREAAGELPEGMYSILLMIEQMPPDKARDAAARLTERFPDLGPGWLARLHYAETDDERAEIVGAGLAAKCDAGTRGLLLVNAEIHALNNGDRSGALVRLADLANSAEEIESTRTYARMLLQRFCDAPSA